MMCFYFQWMGKSRTRKSGKGNLMNEDCNGSSFYASIVSSVVASSSVSTINFSLILSRHKMVKL